MTAITEREQQVLLAALDDEYQAWSTYNQVIIDFGQVRPFTRIRAAEARHIEALLTLCQRFSVTPPDNSWPGRVERYSSLEAACTAAVAAEIANAELYERLLADTEHPDLLKVLRRLQEASQDRHLPAFSRYAERAASMVSEGRGQRRRSKGTRRKRSGSWLRWPCPALKASSGQPHETTRRPCQETLDACLPPACSPVSCTASVAVAC